MGRSGRKGLTAVVAVVSLTACADGVPSTAGPTTSSVSVAPTGVSSTVATTTAPADAMWAAAPSLLRGRSAHGVVASDGALYALGGTGPDGKPVFEVERFDGTAWTDVAEISGYGVNAPSAAAVDGRLYLIGGFSGAGGTPVDDVQVFDLATSTWAAASPLPTASGGHAAAVIGGRIHVIGGGTARSTIADHVAYDPATDRWETLAPLPRAEGSPAAIVLDGRLWAIGGRSGNSDFGDVFVYDPAADVWTLGPPIAPRGTVGAVAACDTIFVVGGESQELDAVLGDVFRLDGADWSAIDPLPTPRMFARAVELDGSIYVVGGSSTPGRSHTSPGIPSVAWLTPTC